MSTYLVDSADLSSVADAIRAKSGGSAALTFPAGFVSEIGNIPSGGGGGWTRPDDWPDLSAMDYTSEVVYMTYAADESNGFCCFLFRTSTGQYSVEIGEIVNGVFTPSATYTVSSNSNCQHYFGSAAGGYKVIRVKALTGSLVGFSFNKGVAFTDNGVQKFGTSQGLLEFYANLGTLTNNDGFFESSRFLQNVHLGSAKLPSSIRSMFSQCRSLAQIDAVSWDTSAVENMSGLFYNCGLHSADIAGWDTSSLNNISDMFCTSAFEEIDLSGWDVSRCTSLHYFCENCYWLKKINVEGWNTSSMTNFVESFYNCNALQEIDVSDWSTGNVTNMQSLFQGCYMLKELDLSGWDFTKVTNLNSFMISCQSISSIVFPSTLKVIGASAFAITRNLFEFHFQSTTPPTLSNTNAFANMTDGGGKKIYVPYSADHSILNAYKTASNWSTYASYIVEEDAP